MPTVARGSTPAVNADGTTSRFRRKKSKIQSGARPWTPAGPRMLAAQLAPSLRVAFFLKAPLRSPRSASDTSAPRRVAKYFQSITPWFAVYFCPRLVLQMAARSAATPRPRRGNLLRGIKHLQLRRLDCAGFSGLQLGCCKHGTLCGMRLVHQ